MAACWGVDDKIENILAIYPDEILYAHYGGTYKEVGAYMTSGFVHGFKKGDVLKWGVLNRSQFPVDALPAGRTYLATFDEETIQRIENIVVDTNLPLDKFIEGEIVLQYDCMIYFATATVNVSTATGVPYLHKVSYKTLTTKRQDKSNGYINYNNYIDKIEYIFPMRLQLTPGLYNDDFRYKANTRCTEKIPVKTGDVIEYEIKISPVSISNNPVMYVMFYHNDKDDVNDKKIADIIVMEKNNVCQFVKGSFTAYRDGKICIGSDLGTDEEKKHGSLKLR